MSKSEIAMQLCIAKLKDVSSHPDAETFGKKIADLYNAIYSNLDFNDDQE